MHPRISVNSLCFPGADLAAMEQHWRALSPDRVSFVSHLLGPDLEQPRRILADGGHRLEAVTHLFYEVQNLDRDPQRWAAERARLDRVVDAVAELGGRSVYLMTGGHAGMTWEEAAACFAEAVAPCVDHAAAAGVRLMIETTSPFYADGHLTHTLRDTVRLAELAGTGVCIDIWATWTEAGLQETIARAAGRCDLVQVSDYVYGDRAMPCRAVPGDGDIPLERILGWILDAGYTGAFDLELIGPRIDAEGHRAAAARAAAAVGDLLDRLT
ncbi:TIM barrel protein [Nocardioides sp. TF02-7]|uniref:sugar phosphate isomerase/epimerase family protein n=1 Tax=Nocardioides sp. TF02-7 TaxID=2917724 RepID=UPI001F06BCC5|nr:TIM barrel protein [Nocardioides sp. TF02-7]UMG91276.1 sugar phosphate isomerase/epimerase [Nocardioides sp. TF02-7]